jgi:hypothetical protein
MAPRATMTANARPDPRVHTMHRNVHAPRRDSPSVARPDRRRDERPVIDHPRLEPRLEVPAAPGAGAPQREEGRVREASAAGRAIGVQAILRLARHRREEGSDRLLATAPWTNAIAVGLKPRFPCGLERGGDERLARPVGPPGTPSRPQCRGVRCGHPDPSHRLGLLPAPQGVRQRPALGWRPCVHPIDAGAPFALMLLGNSPPRPEPGGPRLDPEALECADGAHIITTRGSVEAFLPREDVPLEGLPGEHLPSIHRCRRPRGHRVSTAPDPSTFHVTGAPSASPVAFPGACAAEPILRLTSIRWTPTRHAPCRALMRSSAVPGH